MPKDAKCKCSKRIPPYCGIKTKVGGFRKGHRCHTASEAEMPEATAGVWLPRLDQDSFVRVVQVTAGGLLTVPDSEGDQEVRSYFVHYFVHDVTGAEI